MSVGFTTQYPLSFSGSFSPVTATTETAFVEVFIARSHPVGTVNVGRMNLASVAELAAPD